MRLIDRIVGRIGIRGSPAPLRARALAIAPLVAVAGWLVFEQPGFLIAAFLLPAVLAVGIYGSHRDTAAADTDNVTGLVRRDTLERSLDLALARARAEGLVTAALVVELDEFKSLQERFGRIGVDQLLDAVSRRFSSAVRGVDCWARLDGPTFGLALSPTTPLNDEDLARLAERLLAALTEPIRVSGVDLRPAISIGAARSDVTESETGASLLQGATLAQISAAKSGPGQLVQYSPVLRDRIAARYRFAEDLREALRTDRIVAVFQPQIALEDARLTGVEALARWRTSDQEIALPASFLPAAKESGLMPALGQRILEQALRALRTWDAQGLHVPTVAVNLSTTELSDPTLAARVVGALETEGLSPDRLTVEVLETVMTDGSDPRVSLNLARLADMGCLLDLDDFGTGSSSITTVRRLPIRRIKIDRTFVRDLDREPEQEPMLQAILTMADRLGLVTLAEGVETEAERSALARLGCAQMQGFLLTRPMMMEDMTTWLRTRPPSGEETVRDVG
ncbi:putative bifunctional diguanylate cyclase/phosphodiesterase [Pelagovum pacificum]|nr:bifunctional diguanylate cyclase/phosphodiesterase [Pelagovum pacificum]QQA43370.1 GGDEF domain-containing protein [Pelagovum pacificum]